MKNLTRRQRTITYALLASLLTGAVGLAVFKLYFRQVTFISVTCKNQELNYTERLDAEGEFKCNWAAIDLNTRYVFTLGGK